MNDEQWHKYLVEKLTLMDQHLMDIKIEIAMLKVKSSIWGGITGLIIAGIVAAVFK